MRSRLASSVLTACGALAAASLAAALATPAFAAAPVPATPESHGARRIVSLIPSLTEDLFAIGAGGRVVAVSQFTDHPREATRLPQIGSYASIDTEALARLHPDLIVGIPAQSALVTDARRIGLRVELLADDSFDDLFRTIDRLGVLCGRERAASALVARLKARTARLVATVPPNSHPRAFVVLGVAPIFTVGDGSYIAHLIALAGGRNASGIATPYARYSAEALLSTQPDAIVADNARDLRGVLDTSPWRDLRAVRDGRVYVLDDPGILERPGPRYNDGLAWLIARLHRVRK